MPLFDTHCHLDILYRDKKFIDVREQMADLWTESGLTHLTQISTDLQSAYRAAKLAHYRELSADSDPSNKPDVVHSRHNTADQPEKNEHSLHLEASDQDLLDFYHKIFTRQELEVFYTIGLHPCSHNQIDEVEHLESMARSAAMDPRFVAIGEIGLDYYWEKDEGTIDRQQEILQSLLSLSVELQRPVVIHCRDAFEDTYRMLKEHHNGHGIIHCFTGNLEWAQKFHELGYLISFSGIVTFNSATEIREAALKLPEAALLVETDAPYLAPVPRRGKINQPGYVAHTMNFLAELRGQKPEELGAALFQNSLEIFQLQ